MSTATRSIPRRAARLRESIAADPVGYATNVLGFYPWSKQAEVLTAVRDNARVAVRSCHGTGKTAIAARVVLWYLAAFPNSRVITTAPTFDQVRDLLWSEIRRAALKAPSGLYPTPNLTRLDIGPEWFAVGLSTNEPERFQGHHAEHLLAVFDEASGVGEDIYEASEGFLTAAGARVLLIGNPTRTSGAFYRAFHSERAMWHTIHISAFDSPNFTGEEVPEEVGRALIAREWVDEKARQWGVDSPTYQIRVLGDFPTVTEDAVLGLAAVEAAQERSIPDQDALHPAVISCDVARFGSDETVIAVRTGYRVSIAASYVGKDLMQTVGRVVEAYKDTRTATGITPSIVIDDAGVGGGVTDRLRELGYRVDAFNGGETATDPEGYPNRRSEAWWAFAEAIDRIDLDPDPQLAADLVAPRYQMDSKGRRVVEPKSTTKASLGRSPDRADAVLMAFAPVPRVGFTLGPNIWE